MRPVPETLAAHLAGGATMLATCWRVSRRDGVVLGFTDHDRDLLFDGVTHRARTGFEAAAMVAELGLAVGGGDVAGALSDESLSESALEAGLFDAATVDVFLVNWADPGERMMLARATIGEVKRIDHAFTAELRSVMQAANQRNGRVFAKRCDADFADGRCKANAALWTGAGTVLRGDGRRQIVASGLAGFAAGRFIAGKLTWTSGANRGAVVEVKGHSLANGEATLTLWRPTAETIAAGDGFSVLAGCDKTFATCRQIFANALNFRGFPTMPGNDRVLAVARSGA